MPIVFVHRNKHFYLNFTLRQAKLSNPASSVYLIGNQVKAAYPMIECIPIESLPAESSTYFANCYEHVSPNPFDYELFCFQRWFIVHEFMQQKGYEIILAADSDIMLYGDLNELAQRMHRGNYQAAFSIGADHGWVHCASGHVSCWTRAGIANFCTFLLSLYTDALIRSDWETICANPLLNNCHVGISDMTALYLFYIRNKETILNQSVVADNQVFDHNMMMATNYEHGEYAMQGRVKRIKWLRNGQPIAYNQLKNTTVRMSALHFQGNSKNRIHRYYTGNDLLLQRVFRESRLQAAFMYYKAKAGWQRLRIWWHRPGKQVDVPDYSPAQ